MRQFFVMMLDIINLGLFNSFRIWDLLNCKSLQAFFFSVILSKSKKISATYFSSLKGFSTTLHF